MAKDEGERVYRMPVIRALAFGAALGAALTLGHAISGAYTRAFVQWLMWTSLYTAVSHLFFATRVGPKSFHARSVKYGFHEFAWADVVGAKLLPSRDLELECRHDIMIVLPQRIVSDPELVALLAKWLPRSHPVNRALAR